MSTKKLRYPAIGALLLAAVVGCRKEPRIEGPNGHMIARASFALKLWAGSIRSAERYTRRAAPLSHPELLSWLSEDYFIKFCTDEPPFWYVDAKAKKILDAWNRPIILIAYDGRLAALGSRGPNGKWEGGHNDDIVVPLDEPEGDQR